MNPFLITEPTVISFSGGRTSAYMLWRAIESNKGKLPDDAIVVFCNTGKEHEKTLEFVRDCENRWGVKINWVEYDPNSPNLYKVVSFETASRNGEPFEALIRKYMKLPNPIARYCTGILKIQTVHKFVKFGLGLKSHKEKENDDWVGIRYDEQRRWAKIPRHKTPLVTAKVVKADVLNFWEKQPFDLGLQIVDGETQLGNCDLCFNKSLPRIKSILRSEPERAVWWAKMETIVPSEGGGANLFNQARPSYSEISKYMDIQGDMFEESLPCFCGD